MERRNLSMAVYGGAAISSLLVLVSMFFNYTVSKTGKFNKTGFQVFTSTSMVNKVFIVLSLILAASIIVMGILRCLGMLDDKMYSYIFAALGTALLIVAIILMITIVKAQWKDVTYEYKRGIGMILNLVFSILTAIFCVGALATIRER